MVSETIPDNGHAMDPDEQKTILQNVRYLNRKELVQYVCHADYESREEEKRALGNVSIFGVPEKRIAKPKVGEQTHKKSPKLVRFNSRPQIYKDDENYSGPSFDLRKHSRDRPSTPKSVTKENHCENEKDSNLPPLKRHLIDSEARKNTRGLYSHSSESFTTSTSAQLTARTFTSKLLPNVVHPTGLGGSPPTPDSMLKKVLMRGSFGGSHNSLVSVRDSEIDLSNRHSPRPRKPQPKTLRWLSPKLRDKDSDSSSESSSTRSSALSRIDPQQSNRELMTSPLSTLQFRDTVDTGVSESHSATCRAKHLDMAANYPIMTPEEHLEFIRYALSPSLSTNTQSVIRNRAITISGGEKPDFLLQRRKMKALNKSLQGTASSSYERLGAAMETKIDVLKRPSKKHLQPIDRTLVKNN